MRGELAHQRREWVTIAAQVAEARQAGTLELASGRDHTKAPADEFFAVLAERLVSAGFNVKKTAVELAGFRLWLDHNPEMRLHYADPQVGVEKLLEHYLAWRFTQPSPGQTYIDVGSAGSIWASRLRARGVNAFSLDLSYAAGIRGHRIGADASAVPLPTGSVDSMSLQCAFECFQADSDVLFIKEAARLLRPGGRLAIVPLYVEDTYFISTSPYTLVDDDVFDADAFRVWRDDGYETPFSRHYSPEALAQRLAGGLGLFSSATLAFASNLDALRVVWPAARLYAYYALECVK